MANPEKMRVLDLLEAGKISAEEAVNLLRALSLAPRYRRGSMDEGLQRFARDCNRIAKRVGAKAKVAYKKVQPKIKRASKTVLKKAACALDSLAECINDANNQSAGEVVVVSTGSE